MDDSFGGKFDCFDSFKIKVKNMVKSLFGYAKTTESIAKSGGWNIYDDKFKIASSDTPTSAKIASQSDIVN